ncbi:MAG: alkaline phosphatase [Clostridia bacterium]|nr:alkaline phosphatase [Clostridia bacterium]
MKRFISLFLIVAMAVCAFPFAIIAEDSVLPFTDVKTEYWYYDAVKYTYEEGIFKGVDAEGKVFAPAKNMTRAELVMTLFQLTGVDKEGYTGDTGFSDVSAKSWMSYAVKWGSEMGYVSGVGNGRFNPQGNITRQEFACILYRFAKDYYLTEDVDASLIASFPDASTIASWAKTSLEWAADRKIVSGVALPDGSSVVSPKGTTTRAQAAQMLMTFIKMFDGESADGKVNRDLVFAVKNTAYTEPKNIIYMIGDGTGFNIIEAAENIYHESLYMDKLAMNYIPYLTHQTTYSSSNYITDSAAGGTALATGYKTANGAVAVDAEKREEPYKTVLELAAEKGMSTGIVVTKSVTDATPAAYSSHAYERGLYDEIAEQQTEMMIKGDLDLLLGGGSLYFNDDYCIENGINYTTKKAELKNTPLPLLGLYDYDSMDTFDENQPTLAEMTDRAIELLSEDENGFFLMVEGSQIDVFNHDNKLEEASHEVYEFDKAVIEALEFAVKNPDTLIIITADHETGGLYIPMDPTPDNIKRDSQYTSGGHTERAVPVYALGAGVEEGLDGILENTDIAAYVASLLGEEDFGKKSVHHTLIDETNKSLLVEANSFAETTENGIKVTYDTENKDLMIPLEKLTDITADIKNIRAVHIEITNTGDTRVPVPILTVETVDGGTEDAIPHHEYISPGESVTMAFIIHHAFWADNMLDEFNAFYLGYGSGVSAEFEIGNIYVTDRPVEH